MGVVQTRSSKEEEYDLLFQWAGVRDKLL